jgi:hypothetical protein
LQFQEPVCRTTERSAAADRRETTGKIALYQALAEMNARSRNTGKITPRKRRKKTAAGRAAVFVASPKRIGG